MVNGRHESGSCKPKKHVSPLKFGPSSHEGCAQQVQLTIGNNNSPFQVMLDTLNLIH